MTLHVLTLNWNGSQKLSKLKDSLFINFASICMKDGKLYSEPPVWHIRDNGSKDNSLTLINSWQAKSDHPFKAIGYDIGHNRDNFAQGMNWLFRQTNAEDDDLILLLNNDIVFGEVYALKKMIALINSDVNIGVVGGRLLYPETNILQHASVYFSKQYNYMPFHYRWKKKSTENDEKIKEVQAVTGALLLTRAKYFKNICTTNKSGNSGMYEKLCWAFDDVDCCLSIKYNMNKKIMYHGGIKVFHEESASLNKNPINKLMVNHNVKIFKDKWWGKYQLDD